MGEFGPVRADGSKAADRRQGRWMSLGVVMSKQAGLIAVIVAAA
ncbi:hypothetical protein ACH40F_12335 [Streptomyces sp. NPDC020794]